jgi:hypothetical protein
MINLILLLVSGLRFYRNQGLLFADEASESASTSTSLHYNYHLENWKDNTDAPRITLQSSFTTQETTTTTTTTTTRLPRILVGIFSTMDDELERVRRQTIRETYLSYYKDHNDDGDSNSDSNSNSTNNNADRICSLQDLQTLKVKSPDDCRFIYTFVVGGNPNGPTELVKFNSSHPISISAEEASNANSNSTKEDDIVYLNIKENMNLGKSQTWFKYASTIIGVANTNQQDLSIDFIAKTDTDTMVFPKRFFQRLNKAYLSYGTVRLYLGIEQRNNQPKQRVGDKYMNGELYILSADLAHFISSTECHRSRLEETSAEDLTIGNFVLSHPRPVNRLPLFQGEMHLKSPRLPWLHVRQLKSPEMFRKTWKTYLKHDQGERRFRALTATTTNSNSSSSSSSSSKMIWTEGAILKALGSLGSVEARQTFMELAAASKK